MWKQSAKGNSAIQRKELGVVGCHARKDFVIVEVTYLLLTLRCHRSVLLTILAYYCLLYNNVNFIKAHQEAKMNRPAAKYTFLLSLSVSTRPSAEGKHTSCGRTFSVLRGYGYSHMFSSYSEHDNVFKVRWLLAALCLGWHTTTNISKVHMINSSRSVCHTTYTRRHYYVDCIPQFVFAAMWHFRKPSLGEDLVLLDETLVIMIVYLVSNEPLSQSMC
jgi:hypothetical protein